MPEMVLVKPAHRFTLVDLEPFRHEGAKTVRNKTVRSGRIDFLSHIERGKPKIRYIRKRSSAQEAAGLKIAQPVLISRLQEEGAVEVMHLLCDFVARRLIGPMLGNVGEKVAGDLGPAPIAHRTERCARPFAKALLQQWEIEEPFAGIIDDPDCHSCRTTRDLAEELPQRIGC